MALLLSWFYTRRSYVLAGLNFGEQVNPHEPPPPFVNYHEKGQAPYQRRLKCLLKAIRHAGAPDALVTNLFFPQSQRADQLGTSKETKDFKKACWRIHELIFDIALPRVMITSHGVVEEGLRNKFGLDFKPVSKRAAEHGEWECRHWHGLWQSRTICVVEIPHLSVYA
jgi:hypothetical protein